MVRRLSRTRDCTFQERPAGPAERVHQAEGGRIRAEMRGYLDSVQGVRAGEYDAFSGVLLVLGLVRFLVYVT